MKNEKSKTGRNFLYLLVGGGIGTILALLFAPKTGEKLRAEIADATRKGLDKTEKLAGQLGEKAATIYEDTKTKAGEFYSEAKQTVNSAANQVTDLQEDMSNAVQNKAEQIASAALAGKKEYDREEAVPHHKTAAAE